MVPTIQLRRKQADIRLVTSGRFVARIVERPGLWMSRVDLDRLVGDLWAVADVCVDHDPIRYGILSAAKPRLDVALVTILYERCSGRPIAFTAATLLEMTVRGRRQDVLHLGLTMVVPDHRSRGLCQMMSGPGSLLLLLRNRLRPVWITNVTQVPAAFGKVAELFANVFPTADLQRRPSEDHRAIARELMRCHRSSFGVAAEAGFDEERFVITNAYTGGSAPLKKTFAEAPHHRNPAFNDMCQARLDYDRGDDFLQVGQLTVGTLVRQLRPRYSLSRGMSLPLARAVRASPREATS